MTAILEIDKDGRIQLPQDILAALGARAGSSLRAEVEGGRLEILSEASAEIPVISELGEDGLPVIPESLRPPGKNRLVEAIKADREDRLGKLSR